jgi:hypothetical protein
VVRHEIGSADLLFMGLLLKKQLALSLSLLLACSTLSSAWRWQQSCHMLAFYVDVFNETSTCVLVFSSLNVRWVFGFLLAIAGNTGLIRKRVRLFA